MRVEVMIGTRGGACSISAGVLGQSGVVWGAVCSCWDGLNAKCEHARSDVGGRIAKIGEVVLVLEP